MANLVIMYFITHIQRQPRDKGPGAKSIAVMVVPRGLGMALGEELLGSGLSPDHVPAQQPPNMSLGSGSRDLVL